MVRGLFFILLDLEEMRLWLRKEFESTTQSG